MFIRILYALIFIFCISFSQQIKIPQKAKDLLKKSGLTKKQAEKLLNDNSGFKDDILFDKNLKLKKNEEKQKIVKELETFYEKDKSILNNSNTETDLTKDSTPAGTDKIDQNSSIFGIPNSQYFGYNIFSNSPELFQRSVNESVDPNHIIGPGDEIIIMLWGETEFNQNYIVSRDGYLFIENVGQVFVNGLNVEKMEKKLFKLLKKVYSTLGSKPGSGSTFFDVSLGSQSLRPLRIFALGEINQPGAYDVKSSTSLFTSLYYFNGPKTSGSLRNISLIRGGKELVKIDYYNYLIKGKQINDIPLQRDDIVFIPNRGKTVTVSGEVNREGIYELKDNEGLKELIGFAGGLPITTYLDRIQINRILSPKQRIAKSMDRTIVDISLKDIYTKGDSSHRLYDGDRIQFFKISDRLDNIVTINGAVNRPGDYDYGTGLSLIDLIEKADGLDVDAYLEKVDISRMGINNKTQISINLSKALDLDPEHNLKLLSGDEINIYQLSDRIYKTNVSITGHVKNPGVKEFKVGMDVSDLVFAGGGFEDESHMSNTYFKRAELYRYNTLEKKRSMIPFQLDSVLAGSGLADMGLVMGDSIRIYSSGEILGTAINKITISGYVKRPGLYNYVENMTITDLLFKGGGLGDKFYYESTYLDRADLIRYNDDDFTKVITSFSIKNIEDDQNNDFILKRGDEIRLYSNRMFSNNQVQVFGEVSNPGQFELKQNMTAIDAILEAGGISKNILNCKVDISRFNPQDVDKNKYAEIFTIYLVNDSTIYNIKLGPSGVKSNNDIQLKPYDIVTVRPDPYFVKPKIVSIQGQVFYPGEYVITRPDELITDIINRAGGLKEEAYPMASNLVRDGSEIRLSFEKIIKNPRSKLNFKVLDGDVIFIGSRSNLVVVDGAVNSPGNYQYIKGSRLKNYLNMAGGLQRDASKFAIFVILPNGRSQKMNPFGISPMILDGSKISVGLKKDVVPFNFTEYVTNLTQIYADISQAYLMIILAGR